MVQNAEVVRRPRGRPPVRAESVTRDLVIEAARRAFQEHGYAATSMNDVARRAGVSTRTMYRLIPTKEELLRSVVADRIGRFMPEIDADALEELPLPEALERMLVAYGALTLSKDTIAMNRLVLAEGDHFPEIAAAFYEVAVLRTSQAMAGFLQRQCDRGRIRLDDVQTATGMLRGMMIMEPQRAVMMGRRDVPNPADIAVRARYCARLFLDGCRVAAS